jgi:hypothetical protein
MPVHVTQIRIRATRRVQRPFRLQQQNMMLTGDIDMAGRMRGAATMAKAETELRS